jgi:hypothetical protein
VIAKGYPEDVSRNIVKLSKSTMKALGCSDDDIVTIRGLHGQAVARCFASKHRQRNFTITMDSLSRRLCGVCIGDFVTVCKARNVINAIKLVLKPRGKIRRDEKTRLAIQKSHKKMEGKPVIRGSPFFLVVRLRSNTFCMQSCLVKRIQPKGNVGIIGKNTKIILLR